jgi:hypothetical protein
MIENSEIMSDQSIKTKIAFYAWLSLLLITLATFAVGLSGHVVALIASPWLSFQVEAAIHTGIPVFLTAVKFVTVPVLLLLTPWASHHPTFEHWKEWSAEKFHGLEKLAKMPFVFVWNRIKSLFSWGGSKKDQ